MFVLDMNFVSELRSAGDGRADPNVTALVHGMTIASRNGADFQGTGVALLDSWQAPSA